MDICIAIALSSAVLLRFPGALTLSWEHSVEHFRLEEDYRATDSGALILSEVRTGGLGAGVDVPDEARFIDGQWRFKPALPPLPQVQLANSRFVAGYRVCAEGKCSRLADLIGDLDQPLALRACSG